MQSWALVAIPLALGLGCEVESEEGWDTMSMAIEEGRDGEDDRAVANDDDAPEGLVVWPPPHLLCWDTPITEVSLGEVPDPAVEGHSLQQIVSSQVIVRADGLGCSECHFENNHGNPGDHYRPPVAQGSTATIYPWTKGRSKHKPAYLNPDDPHMTWRGEEGFSQTNAWVFMSFTNYFLNLAAVNNKPQSVADALREWRDDGYCQSQYPMELPQSHAVQGP